MRALERTGIVVAAVVALGLFGASDSDAGNEKQGLPARLAELEVRIAQLESQMRLLMLTYTGAPDLHGRPLVRPGDRDWDGDATRECVDPEPPPSDGCVIGGCSGHRCTDDPGLITTCEWFDAYACYRTATCERQPTGQCGWTPTDELRACLAAAGPTRPVIVRPLP